MSEESHAALGAINVNITDPVANGAPLRATVRATTNPPNLGYVVTCTLTPTIPPGTALPSFPAASSDGLNWSAPVGGTVGTIYTVVVDAVLFDGSGGVIASGSDVRTGCPKV
jgi:hypothetical protein